jgi:hypothetical protein
MLGYVVKYPLMVMLLLAVSGRMVYYPQPE